MMEIAHVVARRSTCARLQVGAVVEKDGKIISTGYNGAPKSMPHCTDVGCLHDHAEDGSPVLSCIRSVHAEVNALLQAGPRAEGATLYVTHYPCKRCWPVILNAGVKQVVFHTEYGPWNHRSEYGDVKLKKMKGSFGETK